MPTVRIEQITTGPKNHFFGYYGVCPWNESERFLVCLESPFQDHLPEPDEPATICLIDTQTRALHRLADTRAWNLQQGAMLHWNPLQPNDEIIYNDRRADDIIAVVRNVRTGTKRDLPRPVSAVSHRSGYAASVTYGRLGRLRKVVGYVGAQDPYPNDPHPADDGIFLIDIGSGRVRLIVSIKSVYELLAKKHPGLQQCHLWFNHTVFSRDDTRLLFLARARYPAGAKRFDTAMFTVGINGDNLREVVPFGTGVSHFDWRNDREIVATFRWDDSAGKPHFLFRDAAAPTYRRLGEGFLDHDGHCTFDPAGAWLVSDPHDDTISGRLLKLYHIESSKHKVLGAFPLGDYAHGDLRCDLHPRWNRTGNTICFDAIDQSTGTRQVHLAHLEFPAGN